MITEKSWEEFKGTGLLLIVNQILHIFGWAIVAEIETEGDNHGTVIRVYRQELSSEDLTKNQLMRHMGKSLNGCALMPRN